MNLKCTQRQSSSDTNAQTRLFHPADSRISTAHVKGTVSSPKPSRLILGPNQSPILWGSFLGIK